MAYFEIYADRKNEYRWRLRAGNHENIANSNEGYVSKSACQNAIDLIKKYAKDAEIKDRTVDQSEAEAPGCLTILPATIRDWLANLT